MLSQGTDTTGRTMTKNRQPTCAMDGAYTRLKHALMPRRTDADSNTNTMTRNDERWRRRDGVPMQTRGSAAGSRAVVGGSDGHSAHQSQGTSSISDIIICPLGQCPDICATSSASCSEQRRDNRSPSKVHQSLFKALPPQTPFLSRTLTTPMPPTRPRRKSSECGGRKELE
ncbi:hypothetical protein C8F01DRAFT_492781 [Mycena amicta]|nr:hypothetical protein C8F01DRAFT_492781 [Mycena amicta]